MSQTETVTRLAVEHLTCPFCSAVPGKPCKIVDGLFKNWGLPRAVPHQLRLDPFIEAWTDGYITAEDESIQAHGR